MAVQRGAQPATHWSVWALALVALVLLAVGLSNLALAVHDPHAQPAVAYTSAVQCVPPPPSRLGAAQLTLAWAEAACCGAPNSLPSTWVGSQYQLFQADWSKGGVHLLLNHSYFDAADIPAGFIPPRPTRIWLNVSDAATPLLGRHVLDQAQYTQQQWFNGTLPIWPSWNGHSDMFTTRNIVISAFAGAKLGAISFTFPAFMCSDAVTMTRCSATGSRKCPQYLRQVHTLASAGLVVTPPPVTMPNKTHWKYAVDTCAQSFETQQVVVDELTYHTDAMQGGSYNMAWCGNWTQLFSVPQKAAVITLRSVDDPYYVAGQATNCTFMLPRPPVAVYKQAVAYLFPGLVAATVAFFMYAGICDLGLGKPAPRAGDQAPLLRKAPPGEGPSVARAPPPAPKEEAAPSRAASTAVELTSTERRVNAVVQPVASATGATTLSAV